MRPRKVVLCLAGSESRLAERAFLLNTRGYEVLRAASVVEAQEHLSGSKEISLLLVDLPIPEWADGAIVKARHGLGLGLRTVVVSNSAGYQDTVADAYLPKGSDSPAEILERVKRLVQSKRGPKRKVKDEGLDAAVLPRAAQSEYATT